MGVQSVYLIEFTYDWNDTWFDNYEQSSSSYWAFWLFFFSILSWVMNCAMVYVCYENSEYFYVFCISMGVSVVLTICSSSSLCKNGCKKYIALLSSSVAMLFANYFLFSALISYDKSASYTILGLDTFISTIATTYLAFKIPERDEIEHSMEHNITEMKNFKEISEAKMENTENVEISQNQNYKLFQIALGCYALYLGMILTNWEWNSSRTIPFVARLFQ